jgi:hypothetical protein
MHPLSAHDILHIWEQGQRQHPVDQALTMLAVACPELALEHLADLPIGQRDAHLLDLWAQTFGATLYGAGTCPQCAERLEFPVLVVDIRLPVPPEAQSLELTTADLTVHFRLPNSADLAAIAAYTDAVVARDLLAQRCVVHASRAGGDISYSELPSEAITNLAGCMLQCDPQAEILLNLQCPACGHGWQLLLDMTVLLWSAICTQAQRLLRDVHTLARAYGWWEADILSLSATRRQFYLDMVTQ